ncbi:MAG: DUF72 domain-containing protein, partial [Nitrospirota bacterium]
HLPTPQTYQKWAAAAPAGFRFAVKGSRYITHILRLQGADEAWAAFWRNARPLGERLGPVLFQLPPGFRADPERLARFLAVVRKRSPGVRAAFEFRHPSWFDEPIYRLLRDDGAALCIAHSTRYPCVEEVTADWLYYRFHGPEHLFGSRYTERELRHWAGRLRTQLAAGQAVYAYFNNDVKGYAVENARRLRELLRAPETKRSRPRSSPGAYRALEDQTR